MQIQSTGPQLTPKLDDRPVSGIGQGAATGRAVALDTPASVLATTKSPGKDEVSDAVKKLNEAMLQSAQSLQFEIDQDSEQIVVKVIDQSTMEVVRQMPTVEALEMAKAIDKMQGLLIRQTA